MKVNATSLTLQIRIIIGCLLASSACILLVPVAHNQKGLTMLCSSLYWGRAVLENLSRPKEANSQARQASNRNSCIFPKSDGKVCRLLVLCRNDIAANLHESGVLAGIHTVYFMLFGVVFVSYALHSERERIPIYFIGNGERA